MWLTKLSRKPGKNRRSFRGQVLRGFVVGLLLIPTLLMMITVGGALLGYHSVSIQGTSMEPTLRYGDALWTKCVDPTKVKVGDIVTLPSGGKLISHRVVAIEPLLDDNYLLVTRGDANRIIERSEIEVNGTVRVSLMRIRYAGYVLEFLGSIDGIVLVGLTALAIAIYVRRDATSQEGQNRTF